MGSFSAFPFLDLPRVRALEVTADFSLSPAHHIGQSLSPTDPHSACLSPPLTPTPHYYCPLHTLTTSSLRFCSRPLAEHPLPSILHPAILVIFQRDQFNHDSFLLNICQELLMGLQRKCDLACPPRPPTICPCFLLTISSDLRLPEYAILPLLCPPNSCPSFKTQLKYLPLPHIFPDLPSLKTEVIVPFLFPPPQLPLTALKHSWNYIVTTGSHICLRQ